MAIVAEYLAIRHDWQGSGRSAKVLSPEPESYLIVDLLLVALNKIYKIFINQKLFASMEVRKQIWANHILKRQEIIFTVSVLVSVKYQYILNMPVKDFIGERAFFCRKKSLFP